MVQAPGGLAPPQVPPTKGPAARRPPRAAMDALPGLLGVPQAEVLEDVLREQFGPLPQLAAICRLKRLPSGGYSSTEDLQLVLERRRVANAKERERVSSTPRAGPRATRDWADFLSSSRSPLPTPEHPLRTRGTHSPPTRGAPGDFDLPRAGSCPSLGV